MTQLKLLIMMAGCHQYELARRAGMTETRLSRIATGRAKGTQEEMSRIADALGKSVDEVRGAALPAA